MSDQTKTIKLSKPITHESKTITEVTVRAATLGDMLMADLVQGETSKSAAIYATICGLPLPAFKQLLAADYMKIVAEADALSGEASAPAQEAAGATRPG
jgi:hypothetical protein